MSHKLIICLSLFLSLTTIAHEELTAMGSYFCYIPNRDRFDFKVEGETMKISFTATKGHIFFNPVDKFLLKKGLIENNEHVQGIEFEMPASRCVTLKSNKKVFDCDNYWTAPIATNVTFSSIHYDTGASKTFTKSASAIEVQGLRTQMLQLTSSMEPLFEFRQRVQLGLDQESVVFEHSFFEHWPQVICE